MKLFENLEGPPCIFSPPPRGRRSETSDAMDAAQDVKMEPADGADRRRRLFAEAATRNIRRRYADVISRVKVEDAAIKPEPVAKKEHISSRRYCWGRRSG